MIQRAVSTLFSRNTAGAQPASLKVNVFWVLSGNVIGSAFTYLMVVLLSKVGSPETVASYGLAQAIALPISTFLTMRLRTVQVTDASNEYAFTDYYGLAVLSAVTAVILISITALIRESGIGVLTVIFLGAYYAFNNIRQVYLAVIQKSERMHLLTVAHVLAGFLNLLFFTLFYLASRQLYLALFGYFLSQGVVWFFYDYPVTRRVAEQAGHVCRGEVRLFPAFHLPSIWKLALTSLPLGIVALLGALLTSIPRLVMDHYLDRKLIGYYVAISSLLVFGNLITVAIGQAVGPRMARYYQESIRNYISLVIRFALMSLGVGALGILLSFLVGRPVLALLFTPEYAEHVGLLHAIMGAGLFLFLFSAVNTPLNAARCFKIQVPLHGMIVVVCFVSSILLVPRFGLHGAAYAVGISYLCGFVGNLFFLVNAIVKKSRI